MNFEGLKEQLGELSKDVKLNLSSLLKPGGVGGLNDRQLFGTALACAYWTKEKELVDAVLDVSQGHLAEADVKAAQTAAIIMGMNNVYYRFLHLIEDGEYKNMPAKLRMTAIANPGVDKVDFETYCLAVSALSGCGMCMNAHADVIKKGGISAEGVQSAVRIASVINSASQTLVIRRMVS